MADKAVSGYWRVLNPWLASRAALAPAHEKGAVVTTAQLAAPKGLSVGAFVRELLALGAIEAAPAPARPEPSVNGPSARPARE